MEAGSGGAGGAGGGDPLSAVGRILNHQLTALTWVDRQTAALAAKIDRFLA